VMTTLQINLALWGMIICVIAKSVALPQLY
jgi:hypothetical protein